MYRLFIDEVGHDNLNTANDPNERYLCLLGVIMDLEEDHVGLDAALGKLKLDTFGTASVVLHRRELINKKPAPFDRLKDSGIRASFDGGLIKLIGQPLPVMSEEQGGDASAVRQTGDRDIAEGQIQAQMGWPNRWLRL